MAIARRLAFLPLLLLLAACGPEAGQPPRAPEPMPVQGVTLGLAATAQIEDAAEVTGSVRSRSVTAVSSRIMGRILALPVAEGSRVEPGQLLAELDDREILAQLRRAEAGLAEAEAGLTEVAKAAAAAAAAQAAAEAQRDLAASTLARFRTLLERQAVAPQEFDQVLARHRASLAEVERAAAEGQAILARRGQILARMESARAEIHSVEVLRTHARITASRAGLVTAKHAEVGAMASPGVPLLTLEDPRRYWLELAVPESLLPRLRVGQSLRLEIEGADLSATARVSEILPATDPATRTAQVRIALPDSGRLRSGLFGRAWIPTGGRKVLQVARAGVVERGQLQGVYVVGPDSVARFRLVRIGQLRGEAVEVLSGLADGERIVTAGTERVVDGARVQAP